MSPARGRGARLAPAALLLALAGIATAAKEPPPAFVATDPAGRLTYQADGRGNRVPDFSHSGYGGGGVPIPDAPVRVVVPPIAGDATARIQAAIDYVSRQPADERGLRGAVLLEAGRHEVAGRLRIAAGGVVLRGRGDGPGGTVLVATGIDRAPLIRIEGEDDRRPALAPPARVLDAFVPIGANRLRLDDASAFQSGNAVVVTHPSTPEWIASLGMDRFPPGEKGSYLNWKPGTMDVRFERRVTAVDGPTIVLDAPLPMALDASLAVATVSAFECPGRIAQVGVEDLRCESAFDPDHPGDEQHGWVGISLDAARDSWVRRATFAHFAGSAVSLLEGGRRITVQDCQSIEPISEIGGYRRHTFYTAGQETLFLRCRSEGGRHDFAAGYLAAGPNAFVACEAVGAHGFSGPIESWATGVLYDNITMDSGGLLLTNRETDDQGAGWAAAGCVLWQCTAPVIACRKPPGGQNWAIGCWGQFVGDGLWQQPNEFVNPDSLYRAQLAERLGPKALEALEKGSASDRPDDAPTIDAAAPELIAARSAEESGPLKPLSLRGGWLVCDDRLMVGGRLGTTWWQGHLLPERARSFGAGLTRFVPGREGHGYTDDLEELTDAMRDSGRAVLEHHWGLWYDRRRDDHQMVRRIDGDAWPPFYELPWARSGRGTAWDGLSKYDLEAFNPWYFARLDRFAGLCDRKGLALIHEAYFQHNILEAGAHWADFAWRPANCLQDTGFPEPPPYVNKKRIFMADAFYDVSHPVRRALHRRYIRHCLDVLGDHPNVVFVTGDEFTGPLEFARFWLDTVVEWERETGRDVLLGLGATKDVQDAILADPARGPAVSVVELKYWWYTPDGSLYDPPGGENLAPRQQLREWKGPKGRSAASVARGVREYRDHFPDKAILGALDGADPWAVLAAGGSIPALPPTTDPRLLATVPRLRPIGPADPGAQQWTLAEPGRSYLVYAAPGQPVRLDLTADPTTFTALRIDPRTGKAGPTGEALPGGRVTEWPAPDAGPTVLWLTAEAGREPASAP